MAESQNTSTTAYNAGCSRYNEGGKEMFAEIRLGYKRKEKETQIKQER